MIIVQLEDFDAEEGQHRRDQVGAYRQGALRVDGVIAEHVDKSVGVSGDECNVKEGELGVKNIVVTHHD